LFAVIKSKTLPFGRVIPRRTKVTTREERTRNEAIVDVYGSEE